MSFTMFITHPIYNLWTHGMITQNSCNAIDIEILDCISSCISLVNMIKFRTNRARLTEVPSLFMSSLRATDPRCRLFATF